MQECALYHSIAGIGGKKTALDGIRSRLNSEDFQKRVRIPKGMKAGKTMEPYPDPPGKDLNDHTACLQTLQ
jgi:hypothetical protein